MISRLFWLLIYWLSWALWLEMNRGLFLLYQYVTGTIGPHFLYFCKPIGRKS